MSKVMSWSTNWPTKVNPDVRRGLGFSLKASFSSFAAERTGGVGGGLLFHGRTQAVEQRIRGRERRLALEHEPEATLGRGALDDQVHAAQLGAVGRGGGQLRGRRRWITPAGVIPAAAAAVPSEAAAVPFRKRRRLKPRALFSDIVSPDSSVDLFLPRLAQS